MLTENLRETYDQLTQFIQIREAQFLGLLPPETQGLALGGVFIQGRPGFGKTELTRAVLKENNYKILSNMTPDSETREASHRTQNVCDKIDAGIPLEEKKFRLLRAFENGWAVWIDEFDACTEGLEKFINALMTGQHPDTGKKADRPGFMLLATGNGAAMSGRKELSSASESRFLNLSMPAYSLENLEVVIQHYRPDFPPELVNNIALKFERSQQTQPWLNLRDLANQLRDIPILKTSPDSCLRPNNICNSCTLQ